MKKLKFPKIPEKPLVIWDDGEYLVALVEKEQTIKMYLWDKVALLWNKSFVFEKFYNES